MAEPSSEGAQSANQDLTAIQVCVRVSVDAFMSLNGGSWCLSVELAWAVSVTSPGAEPCKQLINGLFPALTLSKVVLGSLGDCWVHASRGTGRGSGVCLYLLSLMISPSQVRPINERERSEGHRTCVSFDEPTKQVVLTVCAAPSSTIYAGLKISS